MTGENAALLPIIVADDDGSTVYLCGVCKARREFKSVAILCAMVDDATMPEGPAAKPELVATSAA